MNESRYYIQEQAPAGNFVDSVGLSYGTDITNALDQLDRWQSSWPHRVCRLVLRTDAVIVAAPEARQRIA